MQKELVSSSFYSTLSSYSSCYSSSCSYSSCYSSSFCSFSSCFSSLSSSISSSSSVSTKIYNQNENFLKNDIMQLDCCRLIVHARGRNRPGVSFQFMRSIVQYNDSVDLLDIWQTTIEKMCCLYFNFEIRKKGMVIDLIKSMLLTGSFIEYEIDYKIEKLNLNNYENCNSSKVDCLDNIKNQSNLEIKNENKDNEANNTEIEYGIFSKNIEHDDKIEEIIVLQVLEFRNTLSSFLLISLINVLKKYSQVVISVTHESVNSKFSEFQSIEMTVSLPSSILPLEYHSFWDILQIRKMYEDLQQICLSNSSNITLRTDDLLYKPKLKTLVVMGMNETLIEQEMIDEMLYEIGCDPHKFDSSAPTSKEILKNKLIALQGQNQTLLTNVLSRLTFTEGAFLVCHALKMMGYKLALITQGFELSAQIVGSQLGFDYVLSNHLEVKDNKLTGGVTGEGIGLDTAHMLDPLRKVDWIQLLIDQNSIDKEDVIVIGDYRSAEFLYESCGHHIYFNASKHKDLRKVLYMMGFKNRDVLQFEESFLKLKSKNTIFCSNSQQNNTNFFKIKNNFGLDEQKITLADAFLATSHLQTGCSCLCNFCFSHCNNNVNVKENLSRCQENVRNNTLGGINVCSDKDVKRCVDESNIAEYKSELNVNKTVDSVRMTLNNNENNPEKSCRVFDDLTKNIEVLSGVDLVATSNYNSAQDTNKNVNYDNIDIDLNSHEQINYKVIDSRIDKISKIKAIVHIFGQPKCDVILRLLSCLCIFKDVQLKSIYKNILYKNFFLVLTLQWETNNEDLSHCSALSGLSSCSSSTPSQLLMSEEDFLENPLSCFSNSLKEKNKKDLFSSSDTKNLSTIYNNSLLANNGVLKELVFAVTCLGLKIVLDVSEVKKEEIVCSDALSDGCEKQEDNKAKDVSKNKSISENKLREPYAIVIVKHPTIKSVLLEKMFHLLWSKQINIESMERLSIHNLRVLRLHVSMPFVEDKEILKSTLLNCCAEHGADVALQSDDIMKYCRRLVVFDMDSTLIQQEIIDEIAKCAGVEKEVSMITHQAMCGHIDFYESLKRRVALLSGLKKEKLDFVESSIQFTPGSRKLCLTLRDLGYRLAVVSGGFTRFARFVKQRLGLHHAFANSLEIDENGQLTGRVVGPVVTPQRKVSLLRMLADLDKCSIEQVIAIGDGANDIPMLCQAGLSVAFCAKPKVQEKAKFRLNTRDLFNIIYLLGVSERVAMNLERRNRSFMTNNRQKKAKIQMDMKE